MTLFSCQRINDYVKKKNQKSANSFLLTVTANWTRSLCKTKLKKELTKNLFQWMNLILIVDNNII